MIEISEQQRSCAWLTARGLILVAVVVLSSLRTGPIFAMDTDEQVSKPASSKADAAPIEFWNRTIAWQRGMLTGITASERAHRAAMRLDQLPLNVTARDILLRPVTIEDQRGTAFLCRGQILFFLGNKDLDQEAGENLEQASGVVLQNLDDALRARIAERSWPVLRAGVLFTVFGLVLLIVICAAIWKVHAQVSSFLRERESLFPGKLPLFGFNLLPLLFAIVRALMRAIAWALTLITCYLWVALSLRRFPYTEPWGEQAGRYVLELLDQLGNKAVHALPGLLAVFFIFLGTRWLVGLSYELFEQVAASGSWMDADAARATQRMLAVVAWIFAIIVAYPFIPGSQTTAFKGISVFIGLIISLGSTGIINQIMSGLFAVYSKALKTGEWVKVNDTEGEVLDVGLLAAKIRTIEGQEVTIPNSVLVSTSTINYTRLGLSDGMIISSTVTIGYDAPWRQVHALLLRAADRTPNIRKHPEPYILQRQLSDFYVEYTLLARLEDEKRRIESLSDLHSQIQDAFNECGVQIMSPHYMVQPSAKVFIPPEKWYPPSSDPALGSQS
jgi:small-conductance mechanosensitive channel